MTQVIGFANKFYTLWSIIIEPVYITDSNGKHWLRGHNTHYIYHKNISFDLAKTKVLYPELEVHEDLRGKTTSWIKENKEDLCPHIMKFGKYFGRDINELLEQDFKYLLWVSQESSFSSNGKYINLLPKIQQHFKEIELEEKRLITDLDTKFQKLIKKGFFEFVPEKNLSIYDVCTFIFLPGTFSTQYYNEFVYGLPLVNGKAKRIKGKEVRFEFTEDKSGIYQVIVNKVIIKPNS